MASSIPKSEQPGLFDSPTEDVRIEEVVLYALGDFQARGLLLEGRTLALDRLLAAFRRSFDEFGVEPLSDDMLAKQLARAGAKVDEVPSYVAKHPYRVTVGTELGARSLRFYRVRNSEAG